jgi:hypothetical protein
MDYFLSGRKATRSISRQIPYVTLHATKIETKFFDGWKTMAARFILEEHTK